MEFWHMKKLLAGLTLILSGSANAVTVFAPTDGDVNFLFSTLTSSTLLAMFDDSDVTYAGSSLDIPVPELITFSGPDGFGDWTATNEAAVSLNLTGSPNFILGISTDGGTTWSGDTSVSSVGANAYNVTFSDGTVLEVDVRIVPIPAAVWLFGSGILGLVAVGRRRD
jgi:hypothetical protein